MGYQQRIFLIFCCYFQAFFVPVMYREWQAVGDKCAIGWVDFICLCTFFEVPLGTIKENKN